MDDDQEETKPRWYRHTRTINGITITTSSTTPQHTNYRVAGQALGSLFGSLGSGGGPLTVEEYELRKRFKKGSEGNW